MKTAAMISLKRGKLGLREGGKGSKERSHSSAQCGHPNQSFIFRISLSRCSSRRCSSTAASSAACTAYPACRTASPHPFILRRARYSQGSSESSHHAVLGTPTLPQIPAVPQMHTRVCACTHNALKYSCTRCWGDSRRFMRNEAMKFTMWLRRKTACDIQWQGAAERGNR